MGYTPKRTNVKANHFGLPASLGPPNRMASPPSYPPFFGMDRRRTADLFFGKGVMIWLRLKNEDGTILR